MGLFDEIPLALLNIIETAHKADPKGTETNLFDLRDQIDCGGHELDTQALISSLRTDREVEEREGKS